MKRSRLGAQDRQARTIGAALYRAGVPSGEIIREAERRHWPTFEALCRRCGSVYEAGGRVCMGWREAADRDRRRAGVSRDELRLALWLGGVLAVLLLVAGLSS